jgi:hypothetical protein
MSWKDSKCGQCEYWLPGERPRQMVKGKEGVLMDGPRDGQCFECPPGVTSYVQQTPQGMALITNGQYPPVSDCNRACSRFVRALNLVEA